MIALQQQRCSPAQCTARSGMTPSLPSYRPTHHSGRRRMYSSALSDLAVLAQMIPGAAPSTTAATQNAVQNTLQNAPLGLQETPERLLIAASLVAVAVGGYLLREKAQKK